jgi:hypothetical protein
MYKDTFNFILTRKYCLTVRKVLLFLFVSLCLLCEGVLQSGNSQPLCRSFLLASDITVTVILTHFY